MGHFLPKFNAKTGRFLPKFDAKKKGFEVVIPFKIYTKSQPNYTICNDWLLTSKPKKYSFVTWPSGSES